MSRHLVSLDSHLPPALRDALARVVDVANSLELNVFVTGSTMRDSFAGMPPRELDLVVKAPVAKLGRHCRGGRACGDYGGVRRAVSEARWKTARHSRVDPRVSPQPRFSVNAIALSVTRASRGLLIDPSNGSADIANKELRTLSSHVFTDRPVRMLTLLRLKVRHGFSVYPRTQTQFEDAMEAKAFKHIRPADLLDELRHTAVEPNAAQVLEGWNEAGLLPDLLPVLGGERLNAHGFDKLQKLRSTIPYGIEFPVEEELLFFQF